MFSGDKAQANFVCFRYSCFDLPEIMPALNKVMPAANHRFTRQLSKGVPTDNTKLQLSKMNIRKQTKAL